MITYIKATSFLEGARVKLYIYTALHSGYNHISVTKTFQNIETNYFLPNPTSDYILKEVIRYPKSLTFICFAGHGLLILVYI